MFALLPLTLQTNRGDRQTYDAAVKQVTWQIQIRKIIILINFLFI